ncbi:MAG: substrate-binding domain-containing protein [Prevotella bivia]|uniref:ABC-type phosphate transport system, periplasmic component n=1 Tax=Prevotella bivia DSM 20514 TaxID=868129 RepID=I4Z964_9BACT|nr:substrate-binding domain-containing protein [Prevotella bivia]EIM32756.1 ABC-type phosphate transport system, periplasmic component [Prevotella bivia DSM 20514]KGF38695.1 phosphate-binding protein [Prevotella bivia DNF00650]MDU7315083.1 substrate-binding domain-containing protein [Prevotella bivia]MDZ3817529.1 substrate-binding domain-containing protein [Prevotella bivia]
MRRASYYIVFSTIAIAALVLSACGKKKAADGRTDTPISGTIKFAADESFAPIIEEELQTYQYRFPQTHLLPIYTDDNEGMKLLIDQKVNLFFTSHKLLPSEEALIQTKGPIPSVFPIGYDGIAFIVNKENRDSLLTVTQLKQILSGKVSKWNEVSKENSAKDIAVVFDSKASATLHFVADSILGGQKNMSKKIVAAKNTSAVIEYVHNTPNAIGVLGSNWLYDKRDTTNTTFKKGIRVVAVSQTTEAVPSNSWQPYQAYLLNGRYPFVRTIYAIVADPHKALPWAFANFITGPVGQMIVLKAGLLPYRGNINIREVKVDSGK